MSKQWYAGVSEVDITPPPGLDLAGFAIREQGAIGALDPLFAKTLVLDDSTQRVVLLTVDLLGIASADVKYIREAVHQKTGIPPGNIMIAASHTHSGPATLPTNGIGEIDSQWIRTLWEKLIYSAELANKRLVPVSIDHTTGLTDIGINRRGKIPEGSIHPVPDPAGIIDRELSVIQIIEKSSREPLAILFNCACHPVVLGEDNRYYSADFPGAAREYVEQKLTGKPVVMFTNGACGDINPVEMGTYKIARKLGKRVGENVLKALSSKVQPLEGGLQINQLTVTLPFANVPTIETCRQQIERYERAYQQAKTTAEKTIAHACLGWASKNFETLKRGELATALEIEMQGISIGDVKMVAIPAEVFSETGLFIKQNVPSPVIVIGYGNGNVGYVPPESEIPKGGYEVLEAHKYYDYPDHFSARAEKNIRAAAVQLFA